MFTLWITPIYQFRGINADYHHAWSSTLIFGFSYIYPGIQWIQKETEMQVCLKNDNLVCQMERRNS